MAESKIVIWYVYQNKDCIFFLQRSDKPKAKHYQLWIANEVESSVFSTMDISNDMEDAELQKESYKTYTVFHNKQFGDLRVVWRNGRHMFLFSDVCNSLGIANVGNAIARINESEKDIIDFYLDDNIDKVRLLNAVTCDGLYTLIYNSRKPNACDYLEYVQSQVIPSLSESQAEEFLCK